jgi:predicted outer membrane protein
VTAPQKKPALISTPAPVPRVWGWQTMDRRTALIAPVAMVAGATLLRASNAFAASEPITAGSYKKQVLQYGTLSIKTSYLARQRSSNTDVQAFALGEILEQTAIGQALTDMASPPPVALTPTQKAVLTQIQDAPATSFDNVYLTAQHQAHEELYALQQAFLGSNPVYANQLVHTALIATAFIQNHLYILQQLIAAGA